MPNATAMCLPGQELSCGSSLSSQVSLLQYHWWNAMRYYNLEIYCLSLVHCNEKLYFKSSIANFYCLHRITVGGLLRSVGPCELFKTSLIPSQTLDQTIIPNFTTGSCTWLSSGSRGAHEWECSSTTIHQADCDTSCFDYSIQLNFSSSEVYHQNNK